MMARQSVSAQTLNTIYLGANRVSNQKQQRPLLFSIYRTPEGVEPFGPRCDVTFEYQVDDSERPKIQMVTTETERKVWNCFEETWDLTR